MFEVPVVALSLVLHYCATLLSLLLTVSFVAISTFEYEFCCNIDINGFEKSSFTLAATMAFFECILVNCCIHMCLDTGHEGVCRHRLWHTTCSPIETWHQRAWSWSKWSAETICQVCEASVWPSHRAVTVTCWRNCPQRLFCHTVIVLWYFLITISVHFALFFVIVTKKFCIYFGISLNCRF